MWPEKRTGTYEMNEANSYYLLLRTVPVRGGGGAIGWPENFLTKSKQQLAPYLPGAERAITLQHILAGKDQEGPHSGLLQQFLVFISCMCSFWTWTRARSTASVKAYTFMTRTRVVFIDDRV